MHITYFNISSPMYLEPRHLIERCFSLRTEHLQIVHRKAVNRTWCEKTGLSDWVTDRLVIETDDIVRYQGELFWVRKREKTTATLHPATIPEGHGQPALFCQGKNVIPDTNASRFDACIGELDWMQTLTPAEALNWSEYLKLEREKKRKEDRMSGGNTKKARWKLELDPGTIVSSKGEALLYLGSRNSRWHCIREPEQGWRGKSIQLDPVPVESEPQLVSFDLIESIADDMRRSGKPEWQSLGDIIMEDLRLEQGVEEQCWI